MKLLLASNGGFLIEQGYKLLGIPKDKIKIGYVITASKGTNDISYLERHKTALRKNGYVFEEIDIENKKPEELKNFFADKNVIHVEGGNTFYLLKVVRASGFDQILKNLIAQSMVYVGTSAGASIMGPSIGISRWVPDGTPLNELEALGFVPFLIKSHYTPDKAEQLKTEALKLGLPIRVLKDGQGILVEDNNYRFIGQGDEVRI